MPEPKQISGKNAAMKTQPILSIVLILRNPGDEIDGVCTSLVGDAHNEEIEIIIVDGRPEPKEGLPSYDDITVLSAPGLNMPHLKAFGAAQSHARSIAFLEPKGVPTATWLTTILHELHDHTEAALTGPVFYEGSGSAFDRAAFLFEYGAFARDYGFEGEAPELAGNNMALPNSLLFTTCGDFIKKNGLNKPFVQQRLQNGGMPIRFAQGMAINLHTKHSAGEFLKTRFHYARCFGGMRCAQATTIKAWVYRIGTPVIPLLVMYKAFQRATANPLFDVASFLWLAGISFAWSLGEAVGYWSGSGKSCERLY